MFWKHMQLSLDEITNLSILKYDLVIESYGRIRKKLLALINLITQNKVGKVVVLYKDRLFRFGFQLVEYIANLYDCEIEIVDTTDKIEEQEL